MKTRAEREEKKPSPSPNPVEELYTTVKKNIKGSAMKEAPQIPLHRIDDLYSAVMKKPNNNPATDGAEASPPIPPHTVEELYSCTKLQCNKE